MPAWYVLSYTVHTVLYSWASDQNMRYAHYCTGTAADIDAGTTVYQCTLYSTVPVNRYCNTGIGLRMHALMDTRA